MLSNNYNLSLSSNLLPLYQIHWKNISAVSRLHAQSGRSFKNVTILLVHIMTRICNMSENFLNIQQMIVGGLVVFW